MNEFETSLLSSLKTILADQLKAYEERLLKKELGSGDELLETPSGSNSQAGLKKVFDSRLSFTDGIESTGIASQLICDAEKLKSRYENIGLVGAELIHSNLIENEVDDNLKSIPLDSGVSSSVSQFFENSSTPSPADECNFRSVPIIAFSGVDGSSVVNEVQKYSGNSIFLDYQEGRPFVSEHDSLNVVLNSQVRQVTNIEVKDFNWLNQNFSAEFY